MKNISWGIIMKYRNHVYGISALWIVAFHIYYMVYAPLIPYISTVLTIGNMGVDVFLFLSAIGLSYSVEKNTLSDFYKNRFSRLIIPFLLLSLPFYIWKDFFANPINVMTPFSFLLDMTTLSFWFKDYYELWYISFIIIMYLAFPIFYKAYRKERYFIPALIIAFVLLAIMLWRTDSYIFIRCEKAFSRVPIFLFGIFVSDYVKKDVKINFWSVVFSAILFVVSFIIRIKVSMPVLFTRYIYGIMAVCFVIVSGYVFNFISTKKVLKPILKISEFAGSISLEIYIIHALIIRVIKHYKLFDFEWYLYYIFVFTATILIALTYKKLIKIYKNTGVQKNVQG